ASTGQSPASSSCNLRHSLLLFRVVFPTEKSTEKRLSSSYGGRGLVCGALLPGACIELLPSSSVEKQSRQTSGPCESPSLFSLAVASCPSFPGALVAVSSSYGLDVFEITLPSSDRTGSSAGLEEGERAEATDGVAGYKTEPGFLGIRKVRSHCAEEQGRLSKEEGGDERGGGRDRRARSGAKKFNKGEGKRQRRARGKERSLSQGKRVTHDDGISDICPCRGIRCRHVCHVPWTSSLPSSIQSAPTASLSLSAVSPPRVRILHRLCDGFCPAFENFPSSACAPAEACVFQAGPTGRPLPCPSCGWRLKWKESSVSSSYASFLGSSSASPISLLSSSSSSVQDSFGSCLPFSSADSSSPYVSSPHQFLCRLDLPPDEHASSPVPDGRILWLLYNRSSSGFLLFTMSSTQHGQMACEVRCLSDVWSFGDASRGHEERQSSEGHPHGEPEPVVRDVVPLLSRRESRRCTLGSFSSSTTCIGSAHHPSCTLGSCRCSSSLSASLPACLYPPFARGGGIPSASSRCPSDSSGTSEARTVVPPHASKKSSRPFDKSLDCKDLPKTGKRKEMETTEENRQSSARPTTGEDVSWLLVALVERGSDWLLRLTCQNVGLSSECWRLRAVRCLYTRTHLTNAVCLPDIVVPSRSLPCFRPPPQLSAFLRPPTTSMKSNIVFSKGGDCVEHSIDVGGAQALQLCPGDVKQSICFPKEIKTSSSLVNSHSTLPPGKNPCLPSLIQNVEGWEIVYVIGGRWPKSTLYELRAGYRLLSSVGASDDHAVLDSSSKAGVPAHIHQTSHACLGAWLLPFSAEERDLGGRDPVLERNEGEGGVESKTVPVWRYEPHEGKHVRIESQERKSKESPGKEKDTTERRHRGSEVESQSNSHREKQSRFGREGRSLTGETSLKTKAWVHLVETYEDRTELSLLDENGVKVNNTLGKEEILVEDNERKIECVHLITEIGGTQGSARPARHHKGEQEKPEGTDTLPSKRYCRWRGLCLRADVRTLFIEPFVLSSTNLQRSCTGIIQVVRDGVYVHFVGSVSASLWWSVGQLRVLFTDFEDIDSSHVSASRLSFSREVLSNFVGDTSSSEGHCGGSPTRETQSNGPRGERFLSSLSGEKEFLLSGGGTGIRLWLLTSIGDLFTFRLRCTDTSVALVPIPYLRLAQYLKSTSSDQGASSFLGNSPYRVKGNAAVLASSSSFPSEENLASNPKGSAVASGLLLLLQQKMKFSLITVVIVAPCPSLVVDNVLSPKQPGDRGVSPPVISNGVTLSSIAAETVWREGETDISSSFVEKKRRILAKSACKGHATTRTEVYVWGIAYDSGYLFLQMDVDDTYQQGWHGDKEEKDHRDKGTDASEVKTSIRKDLKANSCVWVGCMGPQRVVHSMSVCGSHLIVGTREGVLLAYSLESLLDSSCSSSEDPAADLSPSEDTRTSIYSSGLPLFLDLPSPVWTCQVGVLPLFLSPIKRVRGQRREKDITPGAAALTDYGGCLVRHGVWGGKLQTGSGEWFLLSVGHEEEDSRVGDLSLNNYIGTPSSTIGKDAGEGEGGTASNQGGLEVFNKAGLEEKHLGERASHRGRGEYSKDVREPSSLNPVLDGTALSPILGGTARTKNTHTGPFSSASVSSTLPCTFRCLPLVSHPVYTPASSLVYRPRRPPSPSASCSSAYGASSCDISSCSASCSSVSFLPQQPRPSEALSAVAWIEEDVEEDREGGTLPLTNSRARHVENRRREKGNSPVLRMLCFYPASYSSPRALWDVETASGMHVTHAVQLPFIANLIAVHPRSHLFAFVGRTTSSPATAFSCFHSSVDSTHWRQRPGGGTSPGGCGLFVCGNLSASTPSVDSGVISSPPSVLFAGSHSSSPSILSQSVVSGLAKSRRTAESSHGERIGVDFSLLEAVTLAEVSDLPYARDLTVLSSWRGDVFVKQEGRMFASLKLGSPPERGSPLTTSWVKLPPSPFSSEVRAEVRGHVQPQCVCFWQPVLFDVSSSSLETSREYSNGVERKAAKTCSRHGLGSRYRVSSSPFLVSLSPSERLKLRRCLRTLLPHLHRDGPTLSRRDLRLLIRLLGKSRCLRRWCEYSQSPSSGPCRRNPLSALWFASPGVLAGQSLRRRLATTLAAAPSSEWRAEDMRSASVRRLRQAEHLVQDRLEFCRLEERRRSLQREFFREEARQHRALRRRISLREQARLQSVQQRENQREPVEGESAREDGPSDQQGTGQEIREETGRTSLSGRPVDAQTVTQEGMSIPQRARNGGRSSPHSAGPSRSSTGDAEPGGAPCSFVGEREEERVSTANRSQGGGPEEVEEEEASSVSGTGQPDSTVHSAGAGVPIQGSEQRIDQVTIEDATEVETEMMNGGREGEGQGHGDAEVNIRASGAEESFSASISRDEEMHDGFYSAREGEEEEEDGEGSSLNREQTGSRQLSGDQAGNTREGDGDRDERWGWLEITALAADSGECASGEREHRLQRAELEQLLSEIREKLRHAEEEAKDEIEARDVGIQEEEEVKDETKKQGDKEKQESGEVEFSVDFSRGEHGIYEEPPQSALLVVVGGRCHGDFLMHSNSDAHRGTQGREAFKSSKSCEPSDRREALREDSSAHREADVTSSFVDVRNEEQALPSELGCLSPDSAFSSASSVFPFSQHRGCLVLFQVNQGGSWRNGEDVEIRTAGKEKVRQEDMTREAGSGELRGWRSVEERRPKENAIEITGGSEEVRVNKALQAGDSEGKSDTAGLVKVLSRHRTEGEGDMAIIPEGLHREGENVDERKVERCASDKGKGIFQQNEVIVDQGDHDSGVLTALCVHLLPFPVEAVVPFLGGRFLAVGGGATVALLELTPLFHIYDSPPAVGQEEEETRQGNREDHMKCETTRKTLQSRKHKRRRKGCRWSVSTVATFTLGDRHGSRVSGLSVSPLDDHLLTVTMESSLSEHSCGRMLLLRWDEGSQQLLGVAAGEDEESRGYQTAGVTVLGGGGVRDDEKVVRSYEVAVLGSAASSPAVSVVSLSPGTGSFEPHSEFSLSSPALQVLPMRPRIAFSGSPFPTYAASAISAVDSFPLDEMPGAVALTKKESFITPSSTSVLVPCLDGSVTSVFSPSHQVHPSAMYAGDSSCSSLSSSFSSPVNICADLCLLFKLLQLGLNDSESITHGRSFLSPFPSTSSASVSPAKALFACSLRQQHLLWLLWRRFEYARLVPVFNRPSIGYHHLLEAEAEAILRLHKVIWKCSKVVEGVHRTATLHVKEKISKEGSYEEMRSEIVEQEYEERGGGHNLRNSEQRGDKEGRRFSSTTGERKDEMVCVEVLKKEISRLKETWEKGFLLLSSKMQASCHCLSLYSTDTSLSTASFCSLTTACFPSSSAAHHSKCFSSSAFSTWRQAAVWLESQAGHVLLLLELLSNYRKKKPRRTSFDTGERPNDSTWRESELSLSFSSSSSLLEQLQDHFTRFLPLTAEAIKRVWQLEDIRLQSRCWGTRLSKDFLSRTDEEHHSDSDRHENKKRNIKIGIPERLQQGNECDLSSSCRSSPASRVLRQLYQESYSLLSALCDELKRQEKASYEKGTSSEEDQGGIGKKEKTQRCKSDCKNLTAADQPEGTSSPALVKTQGVAISRRSGRDKEKKGEDSGETTEMRLTRKSLIERLVRVLKQQSSTFAVASETLVADQPNEKGDIDRDSSSLSSGTQRASPNSHGVVRGSVQAVIGEEDDHRELGREHNFGARSLSSSFLPSESEVFNQLRQLQREMDAARAFLSQSEKSTQVTREEEKQEKKTDLSKRKERGHKQGDTPAREKDSTNQLENDREEGDLLVSSKSSSLLSSSRKRTGDRCVSKESMEDCRPGEEQGEDSSLRKKEHRQGTKMKKKDDTTDQFSDVSLDIEELWSLEGSSFEPTPSDKEENEAGDQHDKKNVAGFPQHRQSEGQHQASLTDGEIYRSDKHSTERPRCEEDKEKIRGLIDRQGGASLKIDQQRASVPQNRTLLEEDKERRIKNILMACRRARQEKPHKDSVELFFEEESSSFSPLSPMYSLCCDRRDTWADKSPCCSHRRTPLEICKKSLQDFLYDDYRLHTAYRDYLPSLLSPPPPPSLSYLSPPEERYCKREPLCQVTEHLRDKDRHPVSCLEREEALNGWRMINQARLRSGGTLAFWWYCTTLAYMVNSPTSLFHLRREIFLCGKESPSYTEKWVDSDANERKEVRSNREDRSYTKRMNEVRVISHMPLHIEKEDLGSSPVLCMSGETWSRDNYATQRRLQRREGFWRDDQEGILVEDSDFKDHPCEGRVDDVTACKKEEEKQTRERPGHSYASREEKDDDSERRFRVERRQERRKIKNRYNDLREEDEDGDANEEDEEDLPPPEAWSLFWGSETEGGTHSRKNKRRKTRRAKLSRKEQEGYSDSQRRPSHSRRLPLASQEGHPISETPQERVAWGRGDERSLITPLSSSSFYPSGDNRMKRKIYRAGGETYMTIDLDLVSVVTHLSADAERELEELLPLLPSRPSSLDQCRRAFYQLAQVSSI
ncbi:srs33, partial [Cystoisospora suis]